MMKKYTLSYVDESGTLNRNVAVFQATKIYKAANKAYMYLKKIYSTDREFDFSLQRTLSEDFPTPIATCDKKSNFDEYWFHGSTKILETPRVVNIGDKEIRIIKESGVVGNRNGMLNELKEQNVMDDQL